MMMMLKLVKYDNNDDDNNDDDNNDDDDVEVGKVSSKLVSLPSRNTSIVSNWTSLLIFWQCSIEICRQFTYKVED